MASRSLPLARFAALCLACMVHVVHAQIQAGYGEADATWHVGATAGQYTNTNEGLFQNLFTGGEVDPQLHSTTKTRSIGVHSRLTIRAIVVEGSNGKRIALVKSDSYLAQDLLLRRVAQILAGGDSGIGYDDILHAATHNHSSPYYLTTSPGVWIFQDAYDQRAFEYQARAMAAAIEQAAAGLQPARMSGTSVEHRTYKGNIAGIRTAFDGTPAGYPREYGDHGLVVLRFESLAGEPIAAFANFGQHPESLDAYNLMTADFLAPLERFVEQDTGAPLVWSQGDVGSAEGPYTGWENAGELENGVFRAWAHVGFAHTERGARLLADDIVRAWQQAGGSEAVVPVSDSFDVGALSLWFPGPLSHPYPGVSNCQSEETLKGNFGAPVLGLPDCQRSGDVPGISPLVNSLQLHGLPVPDHYDAPGYPAVEENNRLRLQAFRLGEVVLGSCACEAQVDLILNFESRADNIEGNIYTGFDWSERADYEASCAADGDEIQCTRPYDKPALTIDADRLAHMRAQIHNDAAGWDAPENAQAANSEPEDPAAIWGNFTHEELPVELGYKLAVGVGHAGDYNGYTVSYREYMAYDHYRKALTSYGPHTADYMVTRLVRMAGALKGGPPVATEPHDAMAQADEARQAAQAQLIGAEAQAGYDAWQAALPDDIGPAAIIDQPADIEQFSAAVVSWTGGSNAIDNPLARVEREVNGDWQPYADMNGAVQTLLRYPEGIEGVAEAWAGQHQWQWYASFEAFIGWPDSHGETPPGRYRFVVNGQIRQDGSNRDYELVSEPFRVLPWGGLSVSDVRADGDGKLLFTANGSYPRSYPSIFPFIRDDGGDPICRTCSFRPWASGGEVTAVRLTVENRQGRTRTVDAKPLAAGEWHAATGEGDGQRVYIAPGDMRSSNGATNSGRIDLISFGGG